MSDDEADEEAALANDRIKMVSILTVVGRQRAKVSKVAAGNLSRCGRSLVSALTI